MAKNNKELQQWNAFIERFITRLPKLDGPNVLVLGRSHISSIQKKFPMATLVDGPPIDYSLLPDKSFDTIYCLNMLEYEEKPWETAKFLVDKLAVGGMIVVAVPSMLFHHPKGNVGDYWRFLHGNIERLFSLPVIKQATCNFVGFSPSSRYIGLCYLLRKS